MEENYLAKWLNNELSPEELKAFEQTEEYQSYAKLKAVSSRLQAPEFDMEGTFAQIKAKTAGDAVKVVALKPYKSFLRIAAAIALLMVGAFAYLNLSNESVTTEIAETAKLTLPDTSEVVLNADSKVTYDDTDWDLQRNITLEGEAFFKVAKGKTFTVSTDLGQVQVLGTQFNVEARKDYFEVSCYEGLVSVTFNNTTQKLPAGASLLFIRGERMERTVSNLEPSWLNHESSFERVPLQFVINELERQFKIDVSLENVDTEVLFTGSFNNTDLETALKSISTPSTLNFKVSGDNVLFYAEDTP
ncbi:MAG: FecR domain-containing protein [Bacteroidota bacterium]